MIRQEPYPVRRGTQSPEEWAIEVLRLWMADGYPDLMGPPAEQVGLARQLTRWDDRRTTAKPEEEEVTEAETVAAIERYVRDHYAGDWDFAFKAYDQDADGKLTRKQAVDFLVDAGLGPNWIALPVVRRVFAKSVVNRDRRLTLQDLRDAIGGK